VSVNPEQLKILCDLAHGTSEQRTTYVGEEVGDYSEMIGQAERSLTHAELLNRDYYRGRFAGHRADRSIVYNWDDIPLEQ